VRVYVAPDATWSAHEVTAELLLQDGTSAAPLVRDTKTISVASTDDDVNSTFNLAVPAASLTAGASYAVAIRDASIAPGDMGPLGTAEFPAMGQLEPLGAESTGPGLKVVVVPIRYNADGSGRLPDTTPAQIEAYRAEMMTHYPTAKVDVTVRAQPMDTDVALDAQGGGWDDVLSQLVQLRADDGVAADVYYYGAFEPAETADEYCAAGCVLGLSGLASDATDATVRASIGAGYTSGESPQTMAHEVGHAHGRPHAPCGGAADPDSDFPYAGGGIGTWGYDIEKRALIPPSGVTDWMGYCEKTWVSDYNYALLAERMKIVNGLAAPPDATNDAPAANFRFVHVDGRGELRWGRTLRLRSAPTSAAHAVHFHDAAGAKLASGTAHYYPYADLPGGFFLVPEAPPGFHHMTIDTPPANVRSTLAR
jgi:hypothetical protein